MLIAGPTACGKSALALELAKTLPVTIINADASQVYGDLRIVSARPTPKDEQEAPHRLFGHVDGCQAYSAVEWANDAKRAITRSQENWRLPVLVGGTGLYIRTLLDGIAPVPEIDPKIRTNVRSMAVSDAYFALSTEDPKAAARLSPNDTTRVLRALEVARSTGKPLSEWQKAQHGGIADQVDLIPIILLPPREWLFERCDARFAAMMETGALEEVRALLARNLDPALPVMRAIGVREIAAMIVDPQTTEVGEVAAQVATRNYAKRQYTWFRNQPPAHWERYEKQLDDDNINKLAIKLRNMTLTS